MGMALDQAANRVDDDRGAEQERAEHREQVGVEAAGPVEDLADPAVDEQDAAGQRAQQGDAHADLFFAGLFGAEFFL